jgi:RNA polymerase sigma-70 factor (ECF subfamily)
MRTGDTNEGELLERLRAGDETAYNAIYFAHVVKLIRFAYSYVGSMAAAEDVVEDAFVYLWDQRATVVPKYGLRAYLFSLVHNRARHALRSDDRQAKMLNRLSSAMTSDTATTLAVEYDVDARALEARLRHAVNALSEDRRRLIRLRWYDELTIPEIAETLGMSPGAVKQRLLRTLDVLRRLLETET